MSNSPVTRQVWEQVYPKIGWAGPYPETIIGAQKTDTVRTVRVIEKELERMASDRFQVVMQRLDAFGDKDSEPDSTYLMIHYLTDSIIGKPWRKMAVGTALSLDTLTWARTLLDNIDLENDEDSAFFALHDLAITLREDTLTWFDMDSTQRVQIEGLADGGTTMKGHAEAVLALLADTFLIRVPEHFEMPSYKHAEEETQPEATVSHVKEQVTVFPNPFSNSFNLRYAFATEAQNVQVDVFDLVGRSVKIIQLRKTQSGQLTI